MKLCFTLTMPSKASWDGKWSGDDHLFAIIHDMGSGNSAKEAMRRVCDNSPYTYAFGDGWVAQVAAHQVDAKTAAAVRRKSKGFCGYDWMVQSILTHGDIRAIVKQGVSSNG